MQVVRIVLIYYKTNDPQNKPCPELSRTIPYNKDTYIFRMDDVQRITAAAFDEIGAERWLRACEHVEKVVEQYKANDYIMYDVVDSVIINLADDSSSDHESSTDTASEGE